VSVEPPSEITNSRITPASSPSIKAARQAGNARSAFNTGITTLSAARMFASPVVLAP
jgi:hypothetical protein